jgi:subtilisin family serine protease
MLRYFTFFSVLLISFSLNSQSVFNADLIKKINYSPSSEIIEVLVLSKAHTELNFSKLPQLKVKYQVGNIYAVSSSIQSLLELAKQSNCVRIEYTHHHLKLMDDTALVRNRIQNVHLGLAPLSQSYDGTGILVGIIDSGCDFTHPDLKTASGNSRIKFLWDMTKPLAANTPSPFGYGQEWNNTDIDLGLCTHSDAADYGHGTASAGIAAGNGLAIGKHEGGAPKADIMVVALDFNKTGFVIADAVQYLINKAQVLNMPLVINASVGDYYGSHDGTDLEAQLIDNLTANIPGRALVASAGNAGRNKFHVGYNTTVLDTNFTWIKNTSTKIDVSEFADTLQIKNVRYTVGVNNTGFSDLGNIGFKNYNYALNTLKRDTIYHNTNRIGVVESIASINSFGVYELALIIKPDSVNYLWRIEHNGVGRIDSWNFDYVSTGLPTATQYSHINKFKIADTLQTICSGFQCSDYVITVGNYVNRNQYIDVNNVSHTTTEVAGEIAQNSSTGPSRRNAVKPDITASGNTIFASGEASTLASFITLYPYKIALGGYHIGAGGTSASSPVVAGCAALYFQKNPTATSTQLKQAIINCSYSDVFTSTILPNYRWGYGKLDAFQMMSCGEATANLHNISLTGDVKIFPNPFHTQSTLSFSNSQEKNIYLYNTTGELVFSDSCKASTYILSKNNLAAGLYVMVCTEKNATYRLKIIVL